VDDSLLEFPNGTKVVTALPFLRQLALRSKTKDYKMGKPKAKIATHSYCFSLRDLEFSIFSVSLLRSRFS
jgi:hypothetical protein